MTSADYARARRLLMRRDPVMRRIIRRIGSCGLADSQHADPFESLVQAIVWQQLSWKAALTIYRRFQAIFDGGRCPAPQALVDAPDVPPSYSVTFTISGYSAGNVRVVVGGDGASSYGTNRSANGTYTEVIAADTDANSYIWFEADADFAGSLDTISVRRSGSGCLIDCTTHKGRVYYIEDKTQSFWYAAAGAYAGTLTQYDLSQFTTTGGELLYMNSWSRDGGSGVDDLAVFVLTTGEVLVYAGSDPSSATDWSMLGRFRIGQPLGRKTAHDATEVAPCNSSVQAPAPMPARCASPWRRRASRSS